MHCGGLVDLRTISIVLDPYGETSSFAKNAKSAI